MPNPHIGRLLRDAHARFERELLDGLRDAQVADIRPTHNAVLRFLDADTGTRASALAERAGLTRQALTQIVDDLERLGYVTREPDPGDRRAKLVVYTPKGRRVFAAGREIIDRIETSFAGELGPGDHQAQRRALAKLRR